MLILLIFYLHKVENLNENQSANIYCIYIFCCVDVAIFTYSLLKESVFFWKRGYRIQGFFFPFLLLSAFLFSITHNALKSILVHPPLCIYLYIAKGLIPRSNLLLKEVCTLNTGKILNVSISMDLQKGYMNLFHLHIFICLSLPGLPVFSC